MPSIATAVPHRQSTMAWSMWPIAAGKCTASNAETGRPYWVHEAGGKIWASTLVADGKVYVGTHTSSHGQFWVLAAGKEKKVLSSIRLDDEPIYGSAVAANGTLYVTTMTRLYAICTTIGGSRLGQ